VVRGGGEAGTKQEREKGLGWERRNLTNTAGMLLKYSGLVASGNTQARTKGATPSPRSTAGLYPVQRIQCLVKGTRAHKKPYRETREAKKDGTPPPPFPMRAWMLLKTIGRIKNESLYPTISMIINRLLATLGDGISYFQHDSLWKSLGIESDTSANP
jgi:hypothetical protein